MVFKNDLNALLPPRGFSVQIPGAKLPTNKDVYIRSMQQQIAEQYDAARMFMKETDTSDWDHWFKRPDNDRIATLYEWDRKANFLECALFYYNIIIDLTWTLCYVAAEYAICGSNENMISFEGMVPIDEAWKLLQRAQKNVLAPTAENNPFGYLAKMAPAYGIAIDMITEFWSNYQSNGIRQLYNYCKHRGKPLYTELQENGGANRLFPLYFVGEKREISQLPSSPFDVMKKVSIKEMLVSLQVFDDEVLFPYVQELIAEIIKVAQPSPLVI